MLFARGRILDPLQEHRPRAVPEQRPGLDVVGIDDAGVGIGTDHQGVAAGSGGDKLCGRDQGVDESGTGRRHVHRRCLDAEPLLDDAGG